MKMFYKICLIVGSVFLAVGLVVAGTGYMIGWVTEELYASHYSIGVPEIWEATQAPNWVYATTAEVWMEDATYKSSQTDYDEFANEEWIYTTSGGHRLLTQEDLADTITSLNIDVEIADVVIIPGYEFSVEIMDYIPENLTCEVNDKTLVIQETTKDKETWRDWMDSFGRESFANGPFVMVTIPDDGNYTFKELNLKVGAGSFTADELHAASATIEVGVGEIYIGELSLSSRLAEFKVGTGSLTVAQLYASDLNVDCGVGQAVISGDISGDCKLKCGIGSIFLTTTWPENAFNYQISCGIGNVLLNDESYQGLGNAAVIDNNAGAEFSIECGIGEVIVNTGW